MNRLELGYAVLLLSAITSALGCASDNDSTVPNKKASAVHEPSAEPIGVYVDDLEFAHHIDEQTWVIDSDVFDFVNFDSVGDTAVAMNGAGNQFNGGKYSRFDWATDKDGKLRYCQTVADAKTAEAAAEVERAAASDWDAGCDGGAWRTLVGPSILGNYVDDYQGAHEISGTAWKIGGQGASLFHLLWLSNSDRYVIAQNDDANTYAPGKFSRFDWFASESEGLYYCQSAYQAETADAAAATTAADATDLVTGCAGFPWSKLTPLIP